MATGNDMMMGAVKLVDGIVGELRGLDLADDVYDALHQKGVIA